MVLGARRWLPPLQRWPDIPYEWRFVVLLAPYGASLLFRLMFGRVFIRLLDRPPGTDRPARGIAPNAEAEPKAQSLAPRAPRPEPS
jgi:hypothetical protein